MRNQGLNARSGFYYDGFFGERRADGEKESETRCDESRFQPMTSGK